MQTGMYEKKYETSYVNIFTAIIIVLTVSILGTIFLVNDAARITKEKLDMMSGIERVNFYNGTFVNDDELTEYYLRITLPVGVNKDDIELKDDCVNRILSVDIPGMTEDFIYSNPIIGSSTHIFEITYSDADDALHLEITWDDVYEHTSFIEKNYLYIGFEDPEEMYDDIVVVDIGHGGYMPGVSGHGVLEDDVNLAIGMYLKELLDESDIKAYFTRTDAESNPTFANRAGLANDLHADMFISIHSNSTGDGYDYSGTTVMFNENDPTGKSADLANLCLETVTAGLGSDPLPILPGSDIYIIRNSQVPVALIEVGFLSNYDEAMKLADPEYQKKAAKAIFDSIKRAYNEGIVEK